MYKLSGIIFCIILIGGQVQRSSPATRSQATTQPNQATQPADSQDEGLIDGETYRLQLPDPEAVWFIDILDRDGGNGQIPPVRFAKDLEVRMIMDVITRMRFVAVSRGQGEEEVWKSFHESDGFGIEIRWVGGRGDGTRIYLTEGGGVELYAIDIDEFLMPAREARVWADWLRAMVRVGQLEMDVLGREEWAKRNDAHQRRREQAYLSKDPKEVRPLPGPLSEILVPAEQPRE